MQRWFQTPEVSGRLLSHKAMPDTVCLFHSYVHSVVTDMWFTTLRKTLANQLFIVALVDKIVDNYMGPCMSVSVVIVCTLNV